MVLLANEAATSLGKRWSGGKALLVAKATWSTGSIQLQVKAGDNATWVDVASATLSDDGTVLVELPICEVRAVVDTATGVYADLFEIPQRG